MFVHLFGSYTNAEEHWVGGLACPTFYNGIFLWFFSHFSLIFLSCWCLHAFFTRLDAPGGHRKQRGYRKGWVACTTIHNGMLLRFFSHFSLIFRSFSRFHTFFMRLDAPGGHRKQRGYRKGWVACKTPTMVCYFDFLVIFRWFSVLFRIFMCLDVLKGNRNPLSLSITYHMPIILWYPFYGHCVSISVISYDSFSPIQLLYLLWDDTEPLSVVFHKLRVSSYTYLIFALTYLLL